MWNLSGRKADFPRYWREAIGGISSGSFSEHQTRLRWWKIYTTASIIGYNIF